MTRPDYCPVANEPCQSLCGDRCSILETVSMRDLNDKYAGRLAIILECLLLDHARFWDEAHALLDEYKAARERVNPSPPTFMGEPV